MMRMMEGRNSPYSIENAPCWMQGGGARGKPYKRMTSRHGKNSAGRECREAGIHATSNTRAVGRSGRLPQQRGFVEYPRSRCSGLNGAVSIETESLQTEGRRPEVSEIRALRPLPAGRRNGIHGRADICQHVGNQRVTGQARQGWSGRSGAWSILKKCSRYAHGNIIAKRRGYGDLP